jgi:hypothetical protein
MDPTQKELEQINETLASAVETADEIAVQAGEPDPPMGISSRADILSKALEGVRADVQALRSELEG